MGDIDTTEDDPLLSNDRSANGESLATAKTTSYGTNGDVAKVGEDPAADSEASKPSGQDEPMFEGLPEVKKRLKYILPPIAVGIFLSAADQTIVVASSGKIGSELESLNNTSWIASAFLLTLTSVQPLYGKLSDIFGRKQCLLFSYTIFGIGCLLCGLARTMPELIAARAFAGIGGGGMTTVVSILMSDIVPLRERGTWQGLLNLVFAAGSGSGAPLGGLMADSIGWRWAFIIQAPLCAVAIAGVALLLDLPQKDFSDWKTKLRRIDFMGAFALVAAVFCLIFGLDRGANKEWVSLVALLPLCLSVPLFVLFIFIEVRIAKEPFTPYHLIFKRALFSAYMCNLTSFASYMGNLFFLPLYYQAVHKMSASQAGLLLLPGVVASVTGSLTAGLLMQKTGKYYWHTVLAFILLCIGFVVIVIFSGAVASSILGISIGLFMVGVGGGTGVTTTLIAILSNVSADEQAVATACSYLFRALGSVLGISLATTIVQQSLKIELRERLRGDRDVDKIAKRVRESLGYIDTLDPKIQAIVRDCYGFAIRNCFVLLTIIGFFSIIAALFLREKKLSR